jgi:hypothetical protein
MYAYDFGDDWQHVLVHEGFESADDAPITRAVSPAKAGVRRRTVAAPTAMQSFSRSSLIPIMKSTSRPFAGPAAASTRRRSLQPQWSSTIRRSAGRRRSGAGDEASVLSKCSALVVGVHAGGPTA